MPAYARAHAAALVAPILLGLVFTACGAIPFAQRPASGYDYASGEPLRIAIINEAGSTWSGALTQAVQKYDDASPYLQFQSGAQHANIIITVKRYSDAAPPQLSGYDFPQGAGGFATVYDREGAACNYPPSPLPLNCSGEIATAQIWLNDGIPAGADIEARRVRLILHELGHAMGLTRHSPDLDIGQLASRYGWPR
jgi:hypothetical protein